MRVRGTGVGMRRSRSRSRVEVVVGWLLYRRKSLWLTSADWYERLSLATRRDGWRVIRIDGALLQLERPRWRRP